MKGNPIIEEYIKDLIGISKLIKEQDEGGEKSELIKDSDQETIVNDCDAESCKFYNEYFNANCRLASIEINPQHGCMQFRPKGNGDGEPKGN